MGEKITSRTKQILEVLLAQNDYVSGNFIAEQLGISKRTVLREMDRVEKIANKYGAKLERIPGKGVLLTIIDPANELLKQLNTASIALNYTPEERQRFLTIELLNANEPKKLFFFASLLQTSEATISNDLDLVASWLQGRGLTLIRKPGYGIKVEGSERDIRKTILELVYDNFSRSELLEFLRTQYADVNRSHLRMDIKKRLLNVIGDQTIAGIEKALELSGMMKKYQLADSAYVALIVHLSLVVQRINAGEKIIFDPVLLEELSESPEYDMSEKVVDAVSKTLQVIIPKDEIGYVTMHLQGAKLRSTVTGESAIRINDYEVIHLAELLILSMEQESGYILSGNPRLMTGLVNHMGPAITRIKMGMRIRNPLLEQVKLQYAKYYDWTNRAVKNIEVRLGNTIPEDEIGYLTMHFGAAIESSVKKIDHTWRVIIACSTGIGSSKLLESRVKKLYRNIKIVSVQATRDIAEVLEKTPVDFIISTISLPEVSIPTVVVSPLLLEEDIVKLETLIATLSPSEELGAEYSKLDFMNWLNQTSEIVAASKELLNNFFTAQAAGFHKKEVIRQAVRSIKTHSEEVLAIELESREALGETKIYGTEGILLHCRSKVVSEAHFGFVYPQETTENSIFAIVMIIPYEEDEVRRKLMGTLTQQLTEDSFWLNAIINQDMEKVYRTLEVVIQEEIKMQMQRMEEANE
ncbi:MAG: transcription antiterminator [Clostridia bacterium]|nr:transcription antiterminator [Clostridia bacterium]